MPLILRKRASIRDLNEKELRFVKHLVSDDLWRPTQAARMAGFKRPSQASSKLMQKPVIQEMLGKEQRRRLERLDLKADEVLHVLATGLFFNPLSLFKPGPDGGWVVEDLDKIPDEIGRCITKVKTRTTDSMDEEGNVTTTTYFELELMNKTKLLELAMKHCGIAGDQKSPLGTQVNVNVGLGGRGLSEVVMDIEKTRAGQIVDGRVIDASPS